MRHPFLSLILAIAATLAAIQPACAQDAEAAPTAALIDKQGLDQAGRSLAAGADNLIEQTGASWLIAEFALGLTPARLLTSAVLLALVALTAGVILRLIRRRAGRIKSAAPQSWPGLILSAARKPAALLVWIYGGYFALVPVFSDNTNERANSLFFNAADKLTDVGGLLALFWLIFRVISAIEKRLRDQAPHSGAILDNVLIPVVGDALRLLVPLVAAILLLPLLHLSDDYNTLAKKLLGMILIGGIGWVIVRAAQIVERAVLARNELDAEDNLAARKIHTQVSMIKRIVVVAAVILSAACMLMLFEPVRQLGASILASAGIAGIILGFAAQRTLGNLFAGIQIALTQPIRLDDVVTLEGEFGRIEEIALTYVVVRIWDLRRMVVPIHYFIEKPFQNWTRSSADILGSVFIYLDYTMPLEPLRQALREIVEKDARWDGKVCGLLVTNATERVIEVRALVSAASASRAFDLRCAVREKLIEYVRLNHPQSLPRMRAELEPPPSGSQSPAAES